LVREVLEKGEREGALAPGGAQVGEGLVWGALVELARAAAQGGTRVGEAEVLASARALWRALAREEDVGPRGSGTPSSGEDSTPRGTSTPSPVGDAEPRSTGTPSLDENTGPRDAGTPSPGGDADPKGTGTPCPGEDSGPRGTGTPSRGSDVPTPETPGSLAAAPSAEVKASPVANSLPGGNTDEGPLRLWREPVADSRPAEGAPRTSPRHVLCRRHVLLSQAPTPTPPAQTRLSSFRASQREVASLTWRLHRPVS
jgi:hypothetical protein